MRKFRRSLLILSLLLCIGFFSIDTRAYATKVRLQVGVVTEFPPYQFLNDNGQCDGLHIDIMDNLAEQEGYIVEYIPFSSKTACAEAFDNGSIDIILGDISNKHHCYTSDISSGTLCLMAPNYIVDTDKELKNNYVISYEYSTASSMLLSKIHSQSLICVGSQKQALNRLIAGDSDLVVGIKESLLRQLDDLGLGNSYTVTTNYLSKLDFAIRVRENDPMLLRSLNRGIADLHGSGEYDKLYSKWIMDENINLRIWLNSFCIFIIVAGTLSLAYVLISLSLQKKLKNQVNIRTQELSQANTQLAQQLKQLEHESDFRNRIIRYSKLGMILFDREYNIILINESAKRLTGTTAKIGDDVRSVAIYREILSRCGKDIFEHSSELQQDVIVLNYEDSEAFSSPHHYRYVMQQIHKNGAVAGVLLSVEDVTAEEQKKQKLFEEEKSESLNNIVAGIAHEIRNPLMAIRTFAAVGAEGDMDSQTIEDFCRFVPSELERINKLIETLINYATPFKGDKCVFDVSVMLSDCVFFANSIVDGREIYMVSQTGQPGQAYIYANKDQIKQVIINLVVNGLDSMKEKLTKSPRLAPLKLSICLSVTATDVEILIRDSGCGMSKEAIEHCRDAFFTTKDHGSGLGLALCEQYVRENQGKLSIESVEGCHTSIRLAFRRANNEIQSICD